ncbi:MAG TPA: diphthine--ammonia ligase [Holophagaceae bacterium]|jgi:diphthine-ammonia ligase|nr:diphthine--ammonia ligase [Holophagaceae bacterium]
MTGYVMPQRLPENGAPFLSSWSGGKDSCLAFHLAAQAGRPAALLTMFGGDGARSRSHGLRPELLQAQANALGLPLHTGRAGWEDYEAVFLEELSKLRGAGVATAVFGDIDLEPHREWEEKVCGASGIACCLPLWKEPRRALLEQFLGLGYRAIIVAAKEGRLDPSVLGRDLDAAAIAEIEAQGCDACGEEGEYHTLVVDGPLFRAPIRVKPGERSLHSGYWFLDLALG